MRFLSKIVGKILSDRERVKQQRLSSEDIKEGLRNKGRQGVQFSGRDEDEPQEEEAEKPKYVKKNNKVLIPEKFQKKVEKAIEDHNLKLVKKLLSKEKWVDPKALHNLLERFESADDGGEFLKELIQESHHEPYFGAIDNLQWRVSEKTEEESKLPHPIPRQTGDLKGTLGKDVPMGGSDPFMWMDTKYSVTKAVLHKHKGKPLTINTRSDLIAHDDYIDAMDKKNHKIRMHMMIDAEGQAKGKSWFKIGSTMEPGAPSTGRRLDAVKKLVKEGFDVTIAIDMLEHPNMPKELKEHFLTPLKVKQLLGATKGVKVVENKVKLTEPAFAKVLRAVGMGPDKKVG